MARGQGLAAGEAKKEGGPLEGFSIRTEKRGRLTRRANGKTLSKTSMPSKGRRREY